MSACLSIVLGGVDVYRCLNRLYTIRSSASIRPELLIYTLQKAPQTASKWEISFPKWYNNFKNLLDVLLLTFVFDIN